MKVKGKIMVVAGWAVLTAAGLGFSPTAEARQGRMDGSDHEARHEHGEGDCSAHEHEANHKHGKDDASDHRREAKHDRGGNQGRRPPKMDGDADHKRTAGPMAMLSHDNMNVQTMETTGGVVIEISSEDEQIADRIREMVDRALEHRKQRRERMDRTERDKRMRKESAEPEERGKSGEKRRRTEREDYRECLGRECPEKEGMRERKPRRRER